MCVGFELVLTNVDFWICISVVLNVVCQGFLSDVKLRERGKRTRIWVLFDADENCGVFI